MKRKQEEIASLIVVGVLILTCFCTIIYVIHTQTKKQHHDQSSIHSGRYGGSVKEEDQTKNR